jgi:hypothetical protein
MKHTLESSKLFPYIAWTAVILFAGFTAHLAWSLVRFVEKITQFASIT